MSSEFKESKGVNDIKPGKEKEKENEKYTGSLSPGKLMKGGGEKWLKFGE